MSINLNSALRRIIICSVDQIKNHITNNNVGAVLSIGSPASFVADEDKIIPPEIVRFSTTNLDRKNGRKIYSLESSFSQSTKKAIRTAVKFLNDEDQSKLIIHCIAGMHRSPAFTFMLLLHIQGEKPDINKALSAVEKLRPNSSLFIELGDYKAELGDKYDDCVSAAIDFSVARSILVRAAKEDIDLQQDVTTLFKHASKLKGQKMSDLLERFGLSKPALRL